jgi:hypothetical protein
MTIATRVRPSFVNRIPSITYWVRGEPDARGETFADAMAARLRDPLWMLTRQWQLGEFVGGDAGSPAYVELGERFGTLAAWQASGQPPVPLASGPIESQSEREPLDADLATAIELGQTAERLLTERGAGALIPLFRTAYSVSATPADASDSSEVTFRRVCGARAIDGVALAVAARAAQPNLPASPVIPHADQGNALQAINDFLAWVTATVGTLGDGDPAAWQPATLSYGLSITGTAPDGSAITLAANPADDGLLEWSALDLQPVQAGSAAATPRGVIPAHLRFTGMPNARFWDFETSGTDLGSIVPDKRDVARLAVMDLMLVHGNDWFVLPVSLAPGALYEVQQLLVHDVFGVLTRVTRADLEAISAGAWAAFTTSVVGQKTARAPFFVFPPSASVAMQGGPPVEEIQFARDDQANMVWALELTTQNAIGVGWSGHERDIARNGGAAPAPPAAQAATVPLTYDIQTRVPEYWIPFLPVLVSSATGSVMLERAAMLRPNATPIEPVGRILVPSSIPAGSPYQVPEEEVARTGVQVVRRVCRSRWVDGSTWVWAMRQSGPARGEANSALRFDLADPRS